MLSANTERERASQQRDVAIKPLVARTESGGAAAGVRSDFASTGATPEAHTSLEYWYFCGDGSAMREAGGARESR